MAALQLEGIGFMKESKPLLPEPRARGPPHRLCRARQRRPERHRGHLRQGRARPGRARCSCRPTRAAGRSAGSSGRRRPAAPSSSPSTSSCSTSPSASCAPACCSTAPTPAPPWSWTRRPARSWRWPATRRSTRTPSGRPSESARRNRAIQDIYEPGSTFKIVTASAAIEERVFSTTEMVDVSARAHPLRASRDQRHAPLRPAVVHRRAW